MVMVVMTMTDDDDDGGDGSDGNDDDDDDDDNDDEDYYEDDGKDIGRREQNWFCNKVAIIKYGTHFVMFVSSIYRQD